ncbi:MAG: A/G-specific adenine glycosylase [Candidatus Puniceispirillales bacterium WSBS_2018_MAG_OTU23]
MSDSVIFHPTTRHHSAAAALLDWYEKNQRQLPWRVKRGWAVEEQLPNPYHVWLSEIMLQQTTVATVRGYFEKFTTRWPTIGDLAAANRDDVMAAWAGLGYYARARNLHAAAVHITENCGGIFPSCEDELRKLSGVGAYTAAAIAAIAFGRRAVVVDGNIERVTARWDAINTPLPAAKPETYAVMDALTPSLGQDSGDFAQAMMDLAASICTPPRKTKNGLTKPSCTLCPLAPTCKTANNGAEYYPKKTAKLPRPDRYGIVLVVEDSGGNIVLERRRDQAMLGGLDVFPGSDWADGTAKQSQYPINPNTASAEVINIYGASGMVVLNENISHIFTHFRVILTVHHLTCRGVRPVLPDGFNWAQKTRLPDMALPTVMVKVARLAKILE